jgi:hypothetical protein
MPIQTNKQRKGQFYTENNEYIFNELPIPYNECVEKIIEPFAGKGDLLQWINKFGDSIHHLPIEKYDIEPKEESIIKRDTLKVPPSYKNSLIITNPPYLAKNKSREKQIYNIYNTNDLYKCFLLSICQNDNICEGGIIIIPAGFFFSPRTIDKECRNQFLSTYQILKVRYFEEQVFNDTTTTVVAFSFQKSPTKLIQQSIEWVLMPHKESKTFLIEKKYGWIIGGDIYLLPQTPKLRIFRYVENHNIETSAITHLTLVALDSGKKEGRIQLQFKENYKYPGKDTSRSYATLCIEGKECSIEEQKKIAHYFNEFIEKKRKETWSLFLPQFRESKEYARKRIPFDLAYRIVSYIILSLDSSPEE